jgi:hypothetical protein
LSPAPATRVNSIGVLEPPNQVRGLAIAPFNGCLDLDGNGVVDPLTDGLMLLRAQFGLTGTAVTNGAIANPTPPRSTWSAIRNYMNANCGTFFAL